MYPLKFRPAAIGVLLCILAIVLVCTTHGVQSWNIVYPFLEHQLGFLSSFFAACQQFASGTALVVAIVVVWVHDPARRSSIVPLLLAAILAGGINTTVKMVAGRARPAYGVRMDEKTAAEIEGYLSQHPAAALGATPGDYWMWFSADRPGLEPLRILRGETDRGKLQPFGEYDSFPSGHATGAFVLGTFLALVFPRTRIVWYALAAGCALARIRFRRHYPGDVLAGSAIGWFSVYAVFCMALPFRWGEWLVGKLAWRRAAGDASPQRDGLTPPPATAMIPRINSKPDSGGSPRERRGIADYRPGG